MNDIAGKAGNDRLSDGSQDASTRSVVMMCGIAGSGKSTYAQALERRGYVRLSIDEEIWTRFGRDAAEFDPAGYEDHKAAAEETLRKRLVDLMEAGRPVVLDTLRRRLAVRNKLHGASSVTVSEDLLNRYLAGFEEPVDEGERMILQD